jgi:hypothetical protein
MLRRNRLTRLAFGIGALFLPLVGLAGWSGAPPFVGAVAALAAGYFAGAALCFQLAEDLGSAWTERGFGVTHDEFLSAYERLGLGAGLAVGAAAAAIYGVGVVLHGDEFSAATLLIALKILVLGILPPLAVPMVMLQIDGRRAAINLLLTLLAALFVGTAILATWLGLLLVPLLRYYALKSQAGRFYRA